MNIKVLGTGCPKCKKLFEATQQAVKELGVEAEVVKIEDIQKITAYGVMMTPALVIDEEVKSAGKVLTADQIAALLKK